MEKRTVNKKRDAFISRLRSQGVNIQVTSKKKKEVKPLLDLDVPKWKNAFH
ncbi:hypothetical protein JF544_09250 [Halobacillus kuroshimensis]|uniref:Uncharacterized protein n=1 Tax=Halobacillus kuroshimensis TaxID=302481 RepID=A0ABS3DVU0_9BACI|nr:MULTISPECIES: hypothetical protein [Halobacillus]MBN8235437.1 hypothetical protein [Halobacillus kuroshimensis]